MTANPPVPDVVDMGIRGIGNSIINLMRHLGAGGAMLECQSVRVDACVSRTGRAPRK